MVSLNRITPPGICHPFPAYGSSLQDNKKFPFLFFINNPVYAESFYKNFIIKVSGIKIGELVWVLKINDNNYSNDIDLLTPTLNTQNLTYSIVSNIVNGQGELNSNSEDIVLAGCIEPGSCDFDPEAILNDGGCFSDYYGPSWHVSINGNDNNCGSEDSPFASIQVAIDISSEGDIVNVSAGTYYEHLVVNNRSHLE